MISDKSMSGKILNEIEIQVQNELTTVKDIIAARVQEEVKTYNEQEKEYFNGFIRPTDAERTINGYKLSNRKKIDSEKQVYIALDAFQKNGFFVLIDNRQTETLEEEVLVNSKTTVSFMKLTALVGG